MKILLIGGGIVLILFSSLVGFGVAVSSLKEGDNNVFLYLVIPIAILLLGIRLIVIGMKVKSK